MGITVLGATDSLDPSEVSRAENEGCVLVKNGREAVRGGEIQHDKVLTESWSRTWPVWSNAQRTFAKGVCPRHDLPQLVEKFRPCMAFGFCSLRRCPERSAGGPGHVCCSGHEDI